MPAIAMIGTRDFYRLSLEIRELYQDAAEHAAERGVSVITGAANGADKIAAQYCLDKGGKVTLVLPWADYEREWVDTVMEQYTGQVEMVTYNPNQHHQWTESVAKYHGNVKALTRGMYALHARNYGIIERASSVIAVPSNKIGGGGTGQGIRIAKALGKPVLNLTLKTDFDKLVRAIEKGRNK